MSYDLYQRSIGPVDDTVRLREVEGGLAGYTLPSWDDLHPYSHDGADLYVASDTVLVDEIEEYLDFLAHKDTDKLTLEDIDIELIEDAARMEEELKERLDELSEHDRLFAHAVQDWTIDELRSREHARGFAFEQGSDESYLETIEVLEALLSELTGDGEDPQLIELAQVWREETLAELRHAKLQNYYELIA